MGTLVRESLSLDPGTVDALVVRVFILAQLLRFQGKVGIFVHWVVKLAALIPIFSYSHNEEDQ
jgi:hypothetical protein